MSAPPTIHWLEDGNAVEATWRSHSDAPPPTRVVVADGKMSADEAYGLVCQGTAILWRGDFQDARQMLAALGRRADRPRRRSRSGAASEATSNAEPSTDNSAEAFHLYRQSRSQRARTLNSLLIPLEPDYSIRLRRAPDIRQACVEAFGSAESASVASLRALTGA
ncbi:MAG: methyltransferase, partial [Burkholderiaceae bacterium]